MPYAKSASNLALGTCLAVALLPGASRGQEARAHASAEERLGTVHLQMSCAPVVQADFDRAVALLHHMMYADARAAFEAVATEDPGCAMARWGVAMTHFQPLWPARPSADALRAGADAAREAEALAGSASEVERSLIAAVAAFYRDPEAGYWTRIRRWAEGMDRAYELRPDDRETAAFYALSLLALARIAEDPLSYHGRAAEILSRIYEEEPTHPGAVHYTIHANDVAGRANRSPDVIGSYGEIAPDVPHALHMPSHIFLRLGDWPKVIEWNEKATAAALRVSGNADVARCGHFPHNPAYLLYAHLQRADDGRALEVLTAVQKQMKARRRYQQEFVCAFHLAAMPARYAVERRAWGEAAALAPRTPEALGWDRYPWPEALTWFARGLGAAQDGDPAEARPAEARMRELSERAAALGEPTWQVYIEVDRRILTGWIAQAEGDAETAVAAIRSAAELEATVQKDPVTPGALYPPLEALGDLLLELGRSAEALEAYEAALEAWPGRYRALLGAARSGRNAGDVETARVYYGRLLETVGAAEWAATEGTETTEGGETTRPGVREAAAYLRSRTGGA